MSDRQDELLDMLLGELPPEAERELRRTAQADPGRDREVRGLQGLLGSLLDLSTEPSGRVGCAVRAAIERRLRVRRREPAPSRVAAVLFGLKVSAVAAIFIAAVLFGEHLWWRIRSAGLVPESMAVRQVAKAPELEQSYIELPEPQAQVPEFLRNDPSLQSFYRLFASVEEVSPTAAWMYATNDLASRRLEFDARMEPRLRQLALRAGGGSRYLEARIESLAACLAQRIDDDLRAGDASVAEVSLALRALMADGSTLRRGPHHETVQRCFADLQERLSVLHGGELATALAGVLDVAVEYGGSKGRLVRDHAARLVDEVCNPPRVRSHAPRSGQHDRFVGRPSMLNWQTTAAQLADAGRVLELAPAFGVDSRSALRARAYLAAHVAERIALSTEERPDLLAAHLYGFANLVDRASIEQDLQLWDLVDFVPDDFVALYHVAWTRFPLRAGWADFQRQLRRIAAVDTPASVTDAAALLLALAANFAAPGSHELLALAER